MIDTIKGYMELTTYNYNDVEHLFEGKIPNSNKNGFMLSTNLSNFKITIKFDYKSKPIKLFFNGSLPKFYYGNNLAQMDWETTEKAIKDLSNNINIDLTEAILTRIDFGLNIVLIKPVNQYIISLLAYKNLGVLRFKDSVAFISKSKSVIFYDKLKEMKTNDKTAYYAIPKEYQNKNILRYEIQLKRLLKQRLELEVVKIKNLFDSNVQNKLVEMWIVGYLEVDKLCIDSNPMFLIQKHNGLMKYLCYQGIEKLGLDKIFNTISGLNFDVKNQTVKRSKLKKSIKELMFEVKENTLEENLITELDYNINFVKELIF